jgi:energy-coupling factor transporter ATP-binding protein EcfA2
LIFHWNNDTIPGQRNKIAKLQKEWVDDCVEQVIMPQAVLKINTILGKDKDRLLVEQNSVGLRKLQDPSFNVSTLSEHRIASVLSQMDGGSIALAGPRGAGKSTLLRKFSGALRPKDPLSPCISVYLTAPAEYVPRDFIAELFQRLCEECLAHARRPLPDPIYTERPRLTFRRLLRRILGFLWLLLRTVISIGLIIWILKPYIRTDYHHMYLITATSLRHWYDHVARHVYLYLFKRFHQIWTIFRIVVVALALLFFPGPWRWRRYIHPSREPALVKSAREYLQRLQVEKTVTWGKGISAPIVRSASLSLSRGGSASYTPWTMPELVRHTRGFMMSISSTFSSSAHAVVVGIDEIDRIGSFEHAE